MAKALRTIGTSLILGCWGMCLLGGTSAILGLLATGWYVSRFEPPNIDSVRTGLAIRAVGAAIGMLAGAIAGIVCRPKPSTSSLLRGCACGGLTAGVLGFVYMGVGVWVGVGYMFPLATVGCAAVLGGTLVFARKYVLVAVFGGALLMTAAGALIGPAACPIVMPGPFSLLFGVTTLFSVLFACRLFVFHCHLGQPDDADAASEGPVEVHGRVTADRFVWCTTAFCVGVSVATGVVLSVWEATLQSRFAVGYVEDSPARYLTIRSGAHATGLALRCNGRSLAEAGGHLESVFRELYRGRPRFVVESRRPVSYRVVFDREDSKAPEIVAGELGLRISKETRTIDALVLRLGPEGCRLKHGVPDKNPSRDPNGRIRWKIGRTMEGVSMDQLAEHLEAKHNHPVVNRTGLDGYWTISRDNRALHPIPGRRNERAPKGKPKVVRRLGDSGIELQWEKVDVEVLVIEDDEDGSARTPE